MPLMPLMSADAADQRAMESCVRPPSSLSPPRQTKLLFISGFSVFSGFSGLSISNLPEISQEPNRVRRELLRSGRLAGPLMPLMDADAADQRAWSPAPDHHHRSRRRDKTSCCSSAASAFSAASAASRFPTCPKFLKNRSGSSGAVGNLAIAGPLKPLMHAEAADRTTWLTDFITEPKAGEYPDRIRQLRVIRVKKI